MLQDLRQAARGLARTPGFTLAAAATLALGLGANTAIFTVVNAALLRPLPFAEPGRLVVVWETMGDWKTRWVAPANFLDWRAQGRSFEGLAGFSTRDVNVTGSGEPERAKAAVVSDNFFDLLGVRPALGRGFTRGEDEGGHRLAVLSHGLWQRRFAGAAGAVGRTLWLDGEPHQVVGVMPATFGFPSSPELWVPGRQGVPFIHSVLRGVDMRAERDSHLLSVLGRLRPGVERAQAQAEMAAIAARLSDAHPRTNRGLGANVVSLREHLAGDVRPTLAVLAGAVAFVLLIACTNVAGLLLARASRRTRETAIRLALGAGRGRLLRQGLLEALVLSAGGGALGLLVAYWGVDAIVALSPRTVPGLDEAVPDGRVLAFTALLSLATAGLFAVVPAAQAARPDLGEMLQEGGRSSGSPARARARRALVVAEVAMAQVLLVGAGLMLTTLLKLRSADAGFDASGLLTFQLSLPDRRYAEPHQRRALYDGVLERARRLPGVDSAEAVMRLPLAEGPINRGLRIEGRPEPAPGEDHSIDYQVVSPGVFRTLRIRLLRGRLLGEGDVEGAPRVAVLNEAAVRHYFPGQDPLGRRIGMGDGDDLANWRTVVGVVADVRHRGVAEEPRPAAFAPYQQDREAWNFMSIVLRTSAPPASLAAAVPALVRAVDPEQPVSNVRTMDVIRDAAVVRPRFLATLLGAFASAAAALAAVGIYGLMAYTTAQRTQELGVRMVLGARRRAILALVLGEGLRLAVAGVSAGLVAALGLSHLLSNLLYGVRPADPVTLAAVSLALAGLAALASYVPARRAAGLDPSRALRCA